MGSRTLPPELLDYSRWPDVQAPMLAAPLRQRYLRLKKAIEAACDGRSASYIYQKWRVSRSSIDYFLGRCTQLHPDGRVCGYRALVKWFRNKEYVRTAEVKPSDEGHGMAGAFGKLLREHPEVKKWLDKEIGRAEGETYREAGLRITALHGEFLKRLRKEGLKPPEYPFQPKCASYDALCAYVRKRIAEGDDAAARRRFGSHADDGLHSGTGKQGVFRALISYEKAAYDEYELPNIATIVLEIDDKEVDIPLSRGYFCPIVDFDSTAVLGHSIAVALRFRAFDLLRAFENSVKPPPVIEHEMFNELEKLPGEGWPAAVVPEVRTRRIANLAVDNHLAHAANAVVGHLRSRTGTTISFGAVRRWISRWVVEGLFSELQVELSRLASTTGSGPPDPAVTNPVGNAVKFRIRLEHLIAIVNKLVARHNARARKSLMMRTPHESLASDWAEGKRLNIVPGYDEEFLANPCIAVEIETRTVRGKRSKGKTPYVQFEGEHYSNDILDQSWNLIGTSLTIHVREDLRTVIAYLPDGREFGVLEVRSRQWRESPHTREMRKEINRLYREGKLKDREGDVIAHYQRFLANEARLKFNAKNPKISREASELARTLSRDGDHGYRVSLNDVPAQPPQTTQPRGRRDFFGRGDQS